jgi:alpha-methylacyl-CoA racemase
VAGTLSGIHIVSTAVNVPGPVAAGMLRDMGATVVKVEPPSGDPLARASPDWYAALCADIEVLRLNLKSAEGRGGIEDLLTRADVLITASRPTSLQRIGLSWPDVAARHPRLCHVEVVGYSAPREEIGGHDLTYQAEAGLITAPGMPRTLIADLAGAQRVVIAALDLLLVRQRTGEAGHAQIALAECAHLFAEPLRHGMTPSTGPLGGADAAYNLYPAREGWVAIAALEPHFRAALASELSVDIDDRAALARVLTDRSAFEWERWAEVRRLPLVAVRE